jgi:hypothetical protein
MEQPTFTQLVQKIHAFYGIRRFIAVFTKAFHGSWSWAKMNPVHVVTPYFFKIHFKIILTSTPPSTK